MKKSRPDIKAKARLDPATKAKQMVPQMNVDGSPGKNNKPDDCKRAKQSLKQWQSKVKDLQQSGLSFLQQPDHFRQILLQPATGPAGRIWECKEGAWAVFSISDPGKCLLSFTYGKSGRLLHSSTAPVLLMGAAACKHSKIYRARQQWKGKGLNLVVDFTTPNPEREMPKSLRGLSRAPSTALPFYL